MWGFLDNSSLTPHGFCLLWDPGLIWLHAGSDLLTAAAYFSIPLALIMMARRRPDPVYGRMFWLFAAFILACGGTHLMAILTLFIPAYWAEGAIKAFTALLSVVTAYRVWPLLAAAERSEARYRLLSENAADVVFERDLALRLTYVSGACLEMFGYRPEELSAGAAIGLVHSEDRRQVIDALRDVVGGVSRRNVTYRARRRDGTWIWVESAMRLIRDPRGRPGAITGIARDISERVAAEERLRASEHRYRLLAENMADAVSCLDLTLRRVYASPSYSRMLGHDPASLLGERPQDLAHPEDRPRLHDMLTRLQQGEQPDPIQFRARRGDGTYLWVEGGGRRVNDGQAIVYTLRDIARRKEAEDKLLAANARLEEMAWLDSLTGLANRRRFDEMLELEFRRCARNEKPLSLILIDVDCFKLYNDRYGHPAGDACLRAVGQAARALAQRPADVAARYGGEEFAVILPDTGREGAACVANQIRQAIRALGIAHQDNRGGMITASLGVVTIHPASGQNTAHDLLKRADLLLYRAKAGGRDNVVSDMAAAE
jgi:diguanylate cyclase (GGDEF)-like protein/PAS domain S-box-containing protein